LVETGKLTVAANDHRHRSRSTPRRPAERAALVEPIRHLRERVDLVGTRARVEQSLQEKLIGKARWALN
jgi:hypothetical protein